MGKVPQKPLRYSLVIALKEVKAGYMEKMDMYSRNQYLKVLRERYLKAMTKKEKTQILNEYCYNTSQVMVLVGSTSISVKL